MSNRDWMGYSRTALALAAAVVVAAPALAQNTTGAIAGRVADASGQPVAGATVTIVHVESGSTHTATTDAQGRYAARGLRAGGPYTITVSKGGDADRRDNVFVTLAETLNLDATLGAAAQTVVVTGRSDSARFNSSTMGSGTAIGSRELQALASVQRNLQDYARTDPRLSQTDKENGGISAAGQNARYNSITIDGVTTNDTYGLEANNLPTLKQPISIDAIQSVQVNLSNYDVTQKGYTGANINAVTKSGTNEFHGSVYYVWRDDSLAGKRYNRSNDSYFEPPAFKEDTRGFVLGGPVVQDRLFFFASYEELKSSRTSPDFGPLGSARTNVGITQSAIDSAIAIARNTWGMDVGASEVPQGLYVQVKDTLLKLDWNISDAHRANLRWTKTEQTDPNLNGFSATGLSLSSWWFNQDKTLESLVGQWFADWTDTFSTELKVSRRDYDSRPTPVNGTRLPAVGLRFSGALPAGTPNTVNANNRFLNLGTEFSRHLNVLETQTTDIYLGATWNVGKHELKFGVDHVDNEIYNAFLQNINGNYTFGCEGTAAAPVSYSFGTVTDCGALTPAQRDQAVLENFQRGLPSAYTLVAPLPNSGRTINDAIAIWNFQSTGVFLQDNFKVTPRFSVTAGVRVDQQRVPARPLFNAAAAAPMVAGSVNGNTVVRNTGGFGFDNTVTLDGNTLVQPRLGFNWKLGNDERRMQLRGGVGLFQGTAANVWLTNPFSNSGMAVTTYNCTTYSNCAAAGATFNPDPAAQRPLPVVGGVLPAANVDFLSPDLEQPSVWKANLAFETELPALPVVGRGVVVGAEWLHTQTHSGIFYQSLNLGAPTARGTDGRPLFYTPQTYSQNCWNGQSFVTTGACAGGRVRALSNASFNNVYLARETEQGHGNAVTLSIGQPATAAALGWTLAYTRTSAKEVSPLTNSTSNSTFGNRNIFDPNEERLQNSNYLIKDRVNASLTWSRAFVSSYRTSVGVFYEGRRGRPYSWTYINDLNGDGTSSNDLMYIPSAPGSGEVVFRPAAGQTAAQAEAAFWQVVDANPGLSSARGGIVGRNNSFAPWVNNFDVRISQELPGFLKEHKTTFTLDILNFGNLLNKRWGRIDEIGFPSQRSFVNFNGLDAQGRYIYSMGSVEDYVTRQAAGESQWAVQATLRYSF